MMNKPVCFISASLLIGFSLMSVSYHASAQDASAVFSEMTTTFPIPGVQFPTLSVPQEIAKKAEQIVKEASAETEQGISSEHSLQTDIVGGRPQSSGGGGGSSKAGGGVNNCPAIMAQHQYASNKAFEFTESYLSDDETNAYGPAKTSLTEAIELIKNTYFVQDAHEGEPSTNTPINVNNTLIVRDAYLQSINSQVLALGLGIQQSLISDAQSISPSPTSGCNLKDDLNINTLTVIATARQTMANIALQIKMLELDAVKRIKETNVLLETPPAQPTPSNG